MKLYRIVKSFIDEWDPEGFLRLGAPSNEYDPESKMIAERITEGADVMQIAETIKSVISETLYQEGDGIRLERCLDAAEKINVALHEGDEPADTVDRFPTPFGFIEVLLNGKNIPFEISRVSHPKFWHIHHINMVIQNCFEVFIDYDLLHKDDEVLVRFTNGELHYSEGYKNIVNAVTEIKGYYAGFGFMSCENPAQKPGYIAYKHTLLDRDGVLFKIISDPAECKDFRLNPEGICIRAVWETAENPFAEEAVSYISRAGAI